MSITINRFSLLLGLPMLLCGLFLTGCEVSEQDVADARKDVAEERSETEQTKIDAAQTIDEKKQELDEARHSTMRTPYDGDAADEAQELDETRRQEQEKVRDEQQETEQAEDKADKMARELAAKKARDAYVTAVQADVDAVDKRLENMRARLADLDEGPASQKLSTEIELLVVKRDSLADALDEVQDADLPNWETKKAAAEQARERIKAVDSSDG